MKPHENDSHPSRPAEKQAPAGLLDEDTPFTAGDPLWDLLGHAREVKVSPYFARNTVRAARLEAECPQRFGDFVRALFRWRTAAIAGSALAITLFVASSLNQHSEWSYGAVAAFSDDKTFDFDIIKNLDELLAMEENSEETALWLNASQP